jgi:hypothetical protein
MKQDGPKLGIGLLIPKADPLPPTVGYPLEETKQPTHPAFHLPSADPHHAKAPLDSPDFKASATVSLYHPPISDSKENQDTANLGEGISTQKLPLTQGEEVEEEKGYE